MTQQNHHRTTKTEATRQFPVVATVAGSDSGGGAGIQADLKTFHHHQVYGTSVLTCVTAQNPNGVRSVQAISTTVVSDQLASLDSYFDVMAWKTGMLYSKELIDALCGHWEEHPPENLVVDPVMVATSGAVLLQDSAVDTLKRRLLPMATLITPNLEEAQLLAEMEIKNEPAVQEAGKLLAKQFGTAVLLKGGHLPAGQQDDEHPKSELNGEPNHCQRSASPAVDWLFFAGEAICFSEQRIAGVNTHGTGCTLSAAIAANLAKGHSLIEAVRRAKQFLQHALLSSVQVGRESFLNHF